MTFLRAPRRRRLAALALHFAVAAAGASVVSACGGSDDDSPAPAPAPAPAPVAATPLACGLSSFASIQLDSATVDAVTSVDAGSYTPTGDGADCAIFHA